MKDGFPVVSTTSSRAFSPQNVREGRSIVPGEEENNQNGLMLVFRTSEFSDP